MDHAAYLDVVVAQTGALAGAARAVGPDATVPATPEWTMAKLVKHCGTTHRWARAVVESGELKKLTTKMARRRAGNANMMFMVLSVTRSTQPR